jgi:hypothetical protein
MSQAGQFQFAPFAPSVDTLTGNTGGAVPPTGGNINVVGTGSVSVAGNPGTSTLTISNSGAVAISFAGDSGTATPAAGVLTLHGANNITTSAAGSTVTFNVTGTTNHAVQVGNASGSLTSLSVGATNTVLLGNTGADPSFGTVPNAALTNSSITLNNGNNITVTGSPVSLGGAASIAVSGTTNHAVQVGNASGSLTSLSVGATGTVLAGNTGADPSFTATPTVTSITFGAGSALSTYVAAGTFTPVLKFGGGTTGITYNTQQASYYQIGGVLYFTISIGLTSKGSSTGVATITGLPVASASTGIWIFGVGSVLVSLPASTSYFYGQILASSSTINLNAAGSNVNSNVADTQFSNTSVFSMNGFYFTA